MPEYDLQVFDRKYTIEAPDQSSAEEAARGHYRSTFMVTLDRLYEGIRRLDAMGDSEGVRVLGREILRIQSLSAPSAIGTSAESIGMTSVPPQYKNSYKGQYRALSYALRESLPEAAVLGVLLGIGIYIVLWIPRLTLRAVRIVRAKPPGP